MTRSRSFAAVISRTLAPDEPPALEEVRRRRAGLHAAMAGLEAALAAPGAAADGWSRTVREALDDLGEVWSRHCADTEAPGAFLDEITAEAPRLSGPVGRMRREHAEVSGLISRLVRRLAVPPGAGTADAWVEEIRSDATTLLGLLVRHRQRSADLVYEAFAVDLGGGY